MASAITTEPIDKWIRGRLGGVQIAETRAPVLVWQGQFPPVYGLPHAAIADGVLQPSAHTEYPGSWFYGPKVPVRVRYDVTGGGNTLPGAAWSLDDPAVADLVVLTWEPGLIEWTEEDEPVTAHPRDPHKRVETIRSSRHVEVAVEGVVLARSDAPVLLFETGLPTRYYLPRDDVAFDLLTPTDNSSVCPYKGTADAYWSYPGPPELANVAWSYSDPFRAIDQVADRISFYNEIVDITVDGEMLERPHSPFSDAKTRPGAEP